MRLTQLRRLRLQRALTQQDLAQRSGVHRVTIAQLELGRDGVLPTTLRKLAEALAVEPHELMGGEAVAEAAYPSSSVNRTGVAEPVFAPARTEDLTSMMEVADWPGVDQFLIQHPELEPLLSAAPRQISPFFPGARLQLRLIEDPEYPDDQHLLLRILATQAGQAATAQLRAFDEAWWLRNAHGTHGLLSIDMRRV
ncbi:MAG: XRE family transcriptional regulator [Chloroflexi bacterium]|nr:XRE family transcriptional regulator [Chloroflexota bacterium]